MLKYETIEVWDAIQLSIMDWIESVIIVGWNIFRGKDKIKEMSDELTKKIVKFMKVQSWISEYDVIRLLNKFQPKIHKWIDDILIIRWDFLRKEGELERFAISLTKDLVKSFLEEEDFDEFV